MRQISHDTGRVICRDLQVKFFRRCLPLIMMFISIVAIDFISLIYNAVYPSYFTLIAFAYIIGYLYVVLFEPRQYKLSTILGVMLVIKFYLFVIGLINGSLIQAAASDNDWVNFHIPQALSVVEKSTYIENLFSTEGTYNGRLTHTIIAAFSMMLSIIGFDGTDFTNIALISELFSFVLCPLTVLLYYKVALIYSGRINFARRSAFFLAMSPFFLISTRIPLKEILLFLSVGLILLYLVNRQGNVLTLFAGMAIMIFERLYLVPLMLLILLLARRFSYVSIIFMILGGVLIELFVGIERALEIHKVYVANLTSLDGSFLPGNDLFSNSIRGFFGPFFLRPLMHDVTNMPTLVAAKYILSLFFGYVAIKAVLNRDGTDKAMLLVVLFIIFFMPFHGTLKIFLLTSFGGIFLDRVALIKYLPAEPRRLIASCGSVSRPARASRE